MMTLKDGASDIKRSATTKVNMLVISTVGAFQQAGCQLDETDVVGWNVGGSRHKTEKESNQSMDFKLVLLRLLFPLGINARAITIWQWGKSTILWF